MYGHSGNDYRVATFYKSYLTIRGFTMQSLKASNSNMPKLTKKAIRNGRTDGPTLIIEKLCFKKIRGDVLTPKVCEHSPDQWASFR